jgi:DNA-binding PadR family transcriptional regulator
MSISPQVFQVLLALCDGPLHGYAIIQDVRDRTDGHMRLTASTLYDALARLVDQDLIAACAAPEEPAPRPSGSRPDSRRRYYRLTRLGRRCAAEEAQRLERVLALARKKHLLPELPARGRR